MTTDLHDLIAAVLDARDATNRDLDDGFLVRVVNVVAEAGSDTDAAARAVEAAVDRALAEGGD